MNPFLIRYTVETHDQIWEDAVARAKASDPPVLPENPVDCLAWNEDPALPAGVILVLHPHLSRSLSAVDWWEMMKKGARLHFAAGGEAAYVWKSASTKWVFLTAVEPEHYNDTDYVWRLELEGEEIVHTLESAS